MTDILNTFNSIKDGFSKYLVAPIAQFGLGGFVFDVEGQTNVDLSADITDHYTENNTTIQDHIAIRPKRIRLDTYVGELVFRNDNSSNASTQTLARKLTVINSYLPVLSSGAQQLKATFDAGRENLTFAKALDTGLNIYSLAKNVLPPTSKQQQAYQYFKALMEQKVLLSVQTPFEFCTNMAIDAIFATQEEDSRFISNFSISLKEIRQVSTETSLFTNFLDRAGIQNTQGIFAGKIQGAEVDTTQKVDLFTKQGELVQ